MMDRRHLLLGLAATPLVACETLDPAVIDGILGGQGGLGALTAGEVALGLKAALDNGVGNALANVGVLDGFLGNDIVRIPLPKVLQDVQSFLAPIGADRLLVDLQTQLNRGAEKAAPVAKDIFLGAVRDLTITDAFDILRGPDTAATEYLRGRTTDRLAQLFAPIMENALNQTGALRLVDDVSSQLKSVPFAPNLGSDARTDLIDHGVKYGLSGVFHYIGEEEKAIRADPAKRTSDILRRVFGA
ncbi:hypothetical protein GCM10011309_12580 [Litorimonas cladophorae]|uniref:DUF4197 domain-containing protein n=1 Tax=Litorimonas cladophorae TaxID=1220491 RepID=A0A918ND79_9PROT|nr:DUF4197 domain-containing protein [Litorimonas cladophorae]GGX64015.1 hypothetical protein GCM10011309_12580 [Litorimonas cladophorae]